MFTNQTATVSLNFPARCLEPVRASRSTSRFLAASCALHETNELVLLRYHSDLEELGIDARLIHPAGPVGAMASSPQDSRLIATTAQDSPTVTIWRAPAEAMDRADELEYNPDTDTTVDTDANVEHDLERAGTLSHDIESRIDDIVWRDTSYEDPAATSTSGGGDLVTVDRKGTVSLWDVSTEQDIRSERTSKWSQLSPMRIAWDPHDASAVSVTARNTVQILDWRADTSFPSGTVSSFVAHRHGVVDVDYNPNKPHVLATAGVDGLVKFWDLRNARRPLLTARGGHAHYAWNVRYNPFHDQLVLSSGTDSAVNLWRVSTISSAPLLTVDNTLTQDRSETSAANVRVARHEHADAVYGVAWSAADAWAYATVAYDGKVALHHVPSKEKYKILV